MSLFGNSSGKSTGTPITAAPTTPTTTAASAVRPAEKRHESPIRGSMKAMADLFHFDYRGQDGHEWQQAHAITPAGAGGSGKPVAPAEKIDPYLVKDTRLMIQRAHRQDVVIVFEEIERMHRNIHVKYAELIKDPIIKIVDHKAEYNLNKTGNLVVGIKTIHVEADVKALINKEPLMTGEIEPIPDLFKDKVDYVCKNFEDLLRLDLEMYELSSKYATLFERKNRRVVAIMLGFKRNFEVILDNLVTLKKSLSERKDESGARRAKLLEEAKNFEVWSNELTKKRVVFEKDHDHVVRLFGEDYDKTLRAEADKKRLQRAGEVVISKIAANNLAVMDLNGSSDPYAVFRWVGSTTKAQTRVINKNLNPEWKDDKDKIKLQWDGISVLQVELWDKDTFNSDDLLGKFTIDLAEEGMNPGRTVTVDKRRLKEVPVGNQGTVSFFVTSPAKAPEKKETAEQKAAREKSEREAARKHAEADLRSGEITVELKSAKNLMKMDMIGSSDPFVEFSIGSPGAPGSSGPFTSTVKNNNLNPVWNEKFVMAWDGKSKLHCAMFDKNTFAKSDPMGDITIDLLKRGLVRGATIEINENLEHVQHGSIQLTIKMAADAAQSRRDSTAKIASLSAEDEKKVREEAAATLKKEVADSQRKIQDADKDIRSRAGPMNIRLVSAKNLIKADLIGSSDPYVVFTCGSNSVKSNYIRNNLNPVWNEDLVLQWDGKSKMHVQVMDKDWGSSDDPIGDCDVDLVEQGATRGSRLEMDQKLLHVKTGSIQFVLTFP